MLRKIRVEGFLWFPLPIKDIKSKGDSIVYQMHYLACIQLFMSLSHFIFMETVCFYGCYTNVILIHFH